MKKLIIQRGPKLAAILLLLFGYSGAVENPSEPDCKVVSSAIRAVASLKAGMTRADVLKDFTEDGGMNFNARTRYTFRKCPQIKIEVEFERVDPKSPEFSPTDKVISVSRPYLEAPFKD